jgi:integrase
MDSGTAGQNIVGGDGKRTVKGRESVKLTIRTCDAAKPEVADYILWDSELIGLGLRVYRSGKKGFTCQWRDRTSGETRRMSLGLLGRVTPDQARDRARVVLGQAAAGQDPVRDMKRQRMAAAERRAKEITVDGLAALYFEASERGLILNKRLHEAKRASTTKTDKGRFNAHIKPLIGSRLVSEIAHSDCVRLMHSIAIGATARAEKGDAPNGRRNIAGGVGAAARAMGLFGSMFTYARKIGLRTDNPVAGIELPKAKTREIALDAGQYAKFGVRLAAQKSGTPQTAAAIIRLLALTGLRRNEAVDLRWSEVDFEQHCLRLQQTKEGTSVRAIGQAALDLLQSLPWRQTTDEFVFTAYPGADYQITGFAKLAATIMRDIPGLPPRLSPHGLRHSFASVAATMDMSEFTIAALLGHKLRGSTSRYVHRKTDPNLILAADNVAGWIARAMGGQFNE